MRTKRLRGKRVTFGFRESDDAEHEVNEVACIVHGRFVINRPKNGNAFDVAGVVREVENQNAMTTVAVIQRINIVRTDFIAGWRKTHIICEMRLDTLL